MPPAGKPCPGRSLRQIKPMRITAGIVGRTAVCPARWLRAEFTCELAEIPLASLECPWPIG